MNEKKALTDINLHMESGEFATIVGSNGAGKSTLFNAIAGSFIPDTGSILLDGVDMTFQPDFRRSKAIGRLFQDPLKGTAPNMTIEENLALAYLRASTHTSPFSRITKADRELFTDRLAGRPAFRRPAPGADPIDGHPGYPQIAVAGRAHCGPGPRHRR